MRLLTEQTAGADTAQVLLRSRLRAVARRMGYGDGARGRMELVASELASNQAKFAGGTGVMQLWEVSLPHPALDVFALDFGPGIEDVRLALEDGYTTAGTMGRGLGTVRRMADEFAIYSVPRREIGGQAWHGVAVWARFHLRRVHPPEPAVGLYVRPLGDAEHNGDLVRLSWVGRRLRWLHVDALGHGPEAARTAGGADGVLDCAESPEEAIASLDGRLTGTRGAVAVAGEVELDAGHVRVCGVGDIAGWLVLNGERRTLGFAPGILGHAHRRLECHHMRFPAQAVLMTASDGIRAGWGLGAFPGLWRLHPQLIAFFLGEVVGRPGDDRSLLVLRGPRRAGARREESRKDPDRKRRGGDG